MRKLLSSLVFLSCISTIGYPQETLSDPDIINPGQKLLTFNQAKLSIGIGIGLETPLGLGDLSTPFNNQDYFGDTVTSIGLTIPLTVNLISPNSRINFSLVNNYSFGSFNTSIANFYDKIKYSKIESAFLTSFNLINNVNMPVSFSLIGGPSATIPLKGASDQYGIDVFEPLSYGIKSGISLGFQYFDSPSLISFDLLYNHPLNDLITTEYKQYLKINDMLFRNANVGYISVVLNVIF